jgi:hypothetical protein
MLDSELAWVGKDSDPNLWMKIDLGSEKEINGLIVQARKTTYSGDSSDISSN